MRQHSLQYNIVLGGVLGGFGEKQWESLGGWQVGDLCLHDDSDYVKDKLCSPAVSLFRLKLSVFFRTFHNTTGIRL